MAFDWIAGLFQSEQTRGLSGDSASAVALDDSNPYYNYRLRRHQAEGDLVADPGLLWYTSPYVKRRTGLGTQIAAERGEGVANFTDVLLILSEEDYARALDQPLGAEPWIQRAQRALSQEFENFCRREQFSRLHSHRQLGFRIVCDASPEVGGRSLGLSEGEFITGLLPNLYTGPVRGSWPVIGVHLNLPGVWEGYQEVGRLFNDQILFTIGNHWLDNFAHPSLREAALYRLQQYPDGSFVHIVNPDLQDRYQVASVQQGGTNVLTLATRDGQPLAYMVLAVIDPPEEASTPEPQRPGIAMPVAPAAKKKPVEADPDVAPPMLIDDALQPIAPDKGRMGGKTIIPDAPSERIFTLQERGALLQKVHFSAFMDGYDVYLGKRGELGTVVEDPAATFQVRKRQVSLKAHIDLSVGGRRVSAGSEALIEGDTTIEIGSEKLDYRDLRGLDVDGWPYVGEIRRPASSNYMIWGDQYPIGRSRECRIVLPDEPRNDNILWKAGVGDGATIRARTGEIPKSRFYTDSIMVASEHATIDTRGDRPRLICSARHCYVYVRRRSEVLPLFPSTSGRSPQEIELEPADEVLIGNCLFQVGFNPAGQASVAPSAPAPEVRFSADSLVDAVSAPDFEELERTHTGPAREPLAPMERPPQPLEMSGMDSVLGAQIEMIDAPEPAPANRPSDRLSAGPVSVPPLEDDGDEPTSPGMVIPRELLEGDDDIPLDDPLPPTEVLRRVDEPVPADPADVRVAGWDEDEWEDNTGPAEIPSDPGIDDPPTSVPAPFPDVAAEDAAELAASAPEEAVRATWSPDEDPPSEPDPTVSEDPTEMIPQVRPPEPEVHEPEAEPEEEEEPEEPDATEIAVAPSPPPPPSPTPPAPPPPPPATPVAADPVVPPVALVGPGGVVFTDDSEAQFELGRPLHIVQSGWTIRGEVTAGNHAGADLVIPENRITPEQSFRPVDYFRLKVRGRKGHLEVIEPSEMLIDENDPQQERYDDLSAITIDVIRRDDQGEEDFVVRLAVGQDASLPDPRAAFVALDYEDPLAAALVTRGLGLATPRRLQLGEIGMTLTWSGEQLRVEDYLDDYRTPDGFRPFFVQQGGQRFVTAPEDGSPLDLVPGDRFVVGNAVYLVRGI